MSPAPGTPSPRSWQAYLPWIDAAAFSVSGVIHLAHPSTFTPIGLWRRDRWAGIASAALLVAIWPANLQDAISTQNGGNLALKIAIWFRLPLQIPLIWFALAVRQAESRGGWVSRAARCGRQREGSGF